jgi:exodeoxyribonuclease V alpha subunit
MLKVGFAKQKFFESFQKTPWIDHGTYAKRDSKWPILDRFLEYRRITYIDYELTCRLLRQFPSATQEIALFLCHLVIASKKGHICIQVSKGVINPSVEQIWYDEEGTPLPNEEAYVLRDMLFQGSEKIPQQLVSDLESELNPSKPICKNGSHYYLQRMWIYETLFLNSLTKHAKLEPSLVLDHNSIGKTLLNLTKERLLLAKQAQAVASGCIHTLTLITGGPGTGKTYTAGHLIRVFWSHLSDDQKRRCQIYLSAPTGKAASNLSQSLRKTVSSIEGFPTFQAKTLHALLGLGQLKYSQDHVRLAADLLIVDESSMIDIKTMAALFSSLKPGSRLIMLGDKNQLPAVEAGSIFADLVDLGSKPSFDIPCISLKECMRVESKSLIEFAHSVNQGDIKQVRESLSYPTPSGVSRLEFSEEKKEAQGQLVNYVAPLYPSIVPLSHKPDELLTQFEGIRLLSPLRKGLFGVETLNQKIWQKIVEGAPTKGCLAIPIMISVNDYRLELFNGETGVFIRKLPIQSLCIEDYALFPSREDGKSTRRIAAALLPKHELAYCISIHKSQGSEFDRVVLVMPEGSEFFGREVFYTAATRSRKLLEIYSSDPVIQKTVEQKGIRLSGIAHRLMTKDLLDG